jgi:hypothetical protein
MSMGIHSLPASTHAEHQEALEHAVLIASELTKEGWSDPLYGDSGNGSHLVDDLYRETDVLAFLDSCRVSGNRRQS